MAIVGCPLFGSRYLRSAMNVQFHARPRFMNHPSWSHITTTIRVITSDTTTFRVTPSQVVVGCWLLVGGWRLVVGGWWLVVVVVVVVVGCCWLLLVVVGCCWLLLVVVGCCWLLLLVVVVGCCCCWLLVVVVGCGCCCCCCSRSVRLKSCLGIFCKDAWGSFRILWGSCLNTGILPLICCSLQHSHVGMPHCHDSMIQLQLSFVPNLSGCSVFHDLHAIKGA